MGWRFVWLCGAVAACDLEGRPPHAPPMGDPDSGVVRPGSDAYQVSHYDVAIDMTTLRVRTRVDLVTTAALDCLAIGFYPPAVHAVSIDGAPAADVAIDLAHGRLHACGAGWPEGSPISLEVEYDLPRSSWLGTQVGYSEGVDLSGGLFQYMLSWVGGCDRNAPCDARPDRFATYRFDITHHSSTTALCAGDIEVIAPGHTVCTFDRAGGPTYSTFALMTSPSWSVHTIGDPAGIDVQLYDVPASGTRAAIQDTVIDEYLAWMIERIGSFPYGDELRIVVAPTFWLGFEHPGNIVVSETLVSGTSSYANALMHVVMHEIAHQWAGDHTTLADTYDFVWKEAMAEYLTFVFEGERIAHDVAQTTALAWKEWSILSVFHLVPEERPLLPEYYGDVYGPGPMILFRQLEVMFSRAAVLDAVTQLLGGGPRAIGVADVQAALERTTGADLDGYFAAWVYGAGPTDYPSAVASFTPSATGWDVSVDLTTADGVARGCAFTVQVRSASGAARDLLFDFGPDGVDPGPVTIPDPTFDPTGYTIDPYNECLVWDAFAPMRRTIGPRTTRRAAIEPWRVSAGR